MFTSIRSKLAPSRPIQVAISGQPGGSGPPDPASHSERILDFIDLLYAAQNAGEIADTVLDGLRTLVPFDSAMMMRINRRTLEMQPGHCCGCSAEDMDMYLRHYAVRDPLVLNPSCLTRLNTSVRLSDLTASTDGQQGASDEFRKRIPFRHAVSVLASAREQPVAAVRLHRKHGQPDFSAEEMKLIDRIAPHIARALQLKELFLEQSPLRETGLLVFGGDRRLLFRSESVINMLRGIALESVIQTVKAGSVLLRNASTLYRAKVLPLTASSLLTCLANEQKTQMPPAIAGDDTRKLPDDNDRNITIIAIEPFRRRHAVANRLEQSGLSRREVTVALCVMRGLNNANIGKQLFIDEKTVKDHLQHIYDKISVRTRTQLISKMLGLDTELAPVANASNDAGLNAV